MVGASVQSSLLEGDCVGLNRGQYLKPGLKPGFFSFAWQVSSCASGCSGTALSHGPQVRSSGLLTLRGRGLCAAVGLMFMDLPP